jgi:hypothetical protein
LKFRSVNYSCAAWTLGNLHQTERREFTLRACKNTTSGFGGFRSSGLMA